MNTASGTRPRHVAYLYANTGGGHRSTALALLAAADRQFGERATGELVNVAGYMPWPFEQGERIYSITVNKFRALYHAVWRLTNNRLAVGIVRCYMERAGGAGAAQLINEHPADVYVSCLSVINQFLPAALPSHRPGARFLSVVTDPMSVHAGFWSPQVRCYTVPTESARNAALRNAIDPRDVTVTGQPVHPDFAARVLHGAGMRARFGLHSGRSVVLLMGGGDGMGALAEIALALSRMEHPIQIVAVCGRNTAARESLENVRSRNPIHSLGFSDQVPELMGCADVLVTKAGPGTIAEAFIAHLPIVLFDAVPGQETGNIACVVENGAGAWCPTASQVSAQVQRWLSRPDDAARVRNASAHLARPGAAMRVAEVIDRVAFTLDGRTNQPGFHNHEAAVANSYEPVT